MSRESIVFTVGTLLLVIPNLGIPDSWKLRRTSYLRSIEKENGERAADSFVEHNGTKVVRE